MKWPDAALLRENVVKFVEMAQRTNQPVLEARGWHIYRVLTTTRPGQTDAERQKGRHYGARAAWLWWKHGQGDKASAEVLWTQEQTQARRSPRLAQNFARRLSQATPHLSQEQIELIENTRVRRWLEMNEQERIVWLVGQLPAPGDKDWSIVEDILDIGTMSQQTRRIARGLSRPERHLISASLWKVLAGQRALPLVGQAAVKLVKEYRIALETELR